MRADIRRKQELRASVSQQEAAGLAAQLRVLNTRTGGVGTRSCCTCRVAREKHGETSEAAIDGITPRRTQIEERANER